MPRRCCEFVDSRLRRSPPDRASAVPYGQAGENATRFPHLAHRSAAAHKLHSTPQQHRINLISGNGETSSRLSALAYSPRKLSKRPAPSHYEALFNGRSRFGVRGSGNPTEKIGLAILDDAHVALSSVRDAFTLVIESKKHEEIYAEITNRFRTNFYEIGRGGTIDDVVSGKEWGAVLEVPSWAWLSKVGETQEYLRQKADEVNRYVWPLVRDLLPHCHCFISRNSASITPILPPVDLLPSFVDCPRRVYMSATIADDSEIIRTFDATLEGVSRPITSVSLAGVGERMILVPELMELGDTAIATIIKDYSQRIAKSKRGVTILTPSRPTAEKWNDVAVYPRTTEEVRRLRFFGQRDKLKADRSKEA